MRILSLLTLTYTGTICGFVIPLPTNPGFTTHWYVLPQAAIGINSFTTHRPPIWTGIPSPSDGSFPRSYVPYGTGPL
jgi:hypothetical protein